MPRNSCRAEVSQLLDEPHEFAWRRERVVGRWRHDGLADLDATRLSDLGVDLLPRQQTTQTGLGALREFDRDGFDLLTLGLRSELVRVEPTVLGAASEITRSDLPDQVAAVPPVVHADGPLAGVVGESAEGGAGVERLDGVAGQRSETHRRHVEQRDVVGLRAPRTAQDDAGDVTARALGRHRVGHELVADRVHVALGAERLCLGVALRPGVDDVADLAIERSAVGVGLHEVLLDLRPDELGHEPAVPEDRIVAQDAVFALCQVEDADQAHDQDRRGDPPPGAVDQHRKRSQR